MQVQGRYLFEDVQIRAANGGPGNPENGIGRLEQGRPGFFLPAFPAGAVVYKGFHGVWIYVFRGQSS
jgi:hypothetical protein